jgi:hypothetical protein
VNASDRPKTTIEEKEMKRIMFSLALAFAVATAYAGVQADPPAHYTTAETPIGTLFKDPAAKAAVAQHFPDLVKSEAVASGQADTLTLRGLQQFKPDVFTDAALAALDAELAKLPAK